LVGLVPITLIWGCSFAAMKVVLQTGISVGAMLAIRFTLGALVLGAFLLLLRVPLKRQALLDGACLGLVAVAAFWLQADGLRFTSTSKSAFITGLYVLFTPLVSLMIRDRLRLSHGLAALVAVAGLYMLVHVPGAPQGGWNRGDTETLICAGACALQIVMTGHYARRSHGLALAFVQVGVWALISWGLAAVMPPEVLADGSRLGGFQGTLELLAQPRAWISIAFLGVLATALAFYAMSTLQAYLGATEAAILYSLEPLFAALLAVSGFVPGIQEHLTLLQVSGGLLILAAMLLAELGPRMLRSPALEPDDAIG